MGDVRVIPVDGPDSVTDLTTALRAALAGGPAVLPVSATDPRRAAMVAHLAPDHPVEPDTALIIATSGSTGEPKGVLLSASALVASATATHTRLGGPGRWLLTLPAHHVAGAQVIVRSLLAGHDPVVREGSFATAAARLFENPGPYYTSLVPTQLLRLLDEPTLLDFDAVLVGGAAASPALVARARAAGIRVVTTYGMSETAGGCVYDGRPLDGVSVRVVGGEIQIAGPTLANGYRRGARFGPWFRTGDLGTVHPDGTLTVHGRADTVINTGGVKIAPAAVENALTAREDVAEVCVVAVPDEEWGDLVAAAVVPADPGHPPRVEALQETVRTVLGGQAVPRLVRFVPDLPLRGPGKIDHSAVRTMLTG